MKERIVSGCRAAPGRSRSQFALSGFAQTVASQGERKASIPRNRGGPTYTGFVQSLRAERCGMLGGTRGWSGSGVGACLGSGAVGGRVSGLGLLVPSLVALYNPCGFGWLYGSSSGVLNPSGSGSGLTSVSFLGWVSAWTWDWSSVLPGLGPRRVVPYHPQDRTGLDLQQATEKTRHGTV